jgi:hypothetical protein
LIDRTGNNAVPTLILSAQTRMERVKGIEPSYSARKSRIFAAYSRAVFAKTD